MINILYSEFIKLKRSFVLIISVLGGAVIPAFMWFGWYMQDHEADWPKYAENSEMIMFFLLAPLLFALISGYIFSREHTDKTANITYTYQNHKFKIFIGKLIIVCSLIIVVYSINFVAMFISGLLLKHNPIAKDFLLLHLKLYGESLILQFALTPIVIVIANLSKNIIVPIIYGIVASVSNMCIIGLEQKKYSLFILPLMPFISTEGDKVGRVFDGPQGILCSETIIIGIIVFVLGFAACMVYYLKADIN